MRIVAYYTTLHEKLQPQPSGERRFNSHLTSPRGDVL